MRDKSCATFLNIAMVMLTLLVVSIIVGIRLDRLEDRVKTLESQIATLAK